MKTETLRHIHSLGAKTISGSVLWPNGLGFDSGPVQFAYSEAYHGWNASTGTTCGSGRTPEEALTNLRSKSGLWRNRPNH